MQRIFAFHLCFFFVHHWHHIRFLICISFSRPPVHSSHKRCVEEWENMNVQKCDWMVGSLSVRQTISSICICCFELNGKYVISRIANAHCVCVFFLAFCSYINPYSCADTMISFDQPHTNLRSNLFRGNSVKPIFD